MSDNIENQNLSTCPNSVAGKLARLAPAGFYLGIRVGYFYPEFELRSLPKGWEHIYHQEGLIMSDPLVLWAYENIGTSRWGDTGKPDTRDIRERAAGFGLVYGAVASISGDRASGLRSFGIFYRSDRQYFDNELEELFETLLQCHDENSPPSDITEREIEALKLLHEGKQIKEAAYELGISDSAFKQRISNARRKFGGVSASQAVTKANSFGFFAN